MTSNYQTYVEGTSQARLLRELRRITREHKIRQHHIATELGVTTSTVSNLFTGYTRMHLGHADAIAKLTGHRLLITLIPEDHLRALLTDDDEPDDTDDDWDDE